jgi:ribosomal subunit interface protein
MEIRIKSTKFEPTEDLKSYIHKKMNMLKKYLGDTVVLNCDVELDHSLSKQNKGKIYRAEVNLTLPGTFLRVDKTEKTINKAIDKVKDHLVLMIKKHKEKQIDKKKRVAKK